MSNATTDEVVNQFIQEKRKLDIQTKELESSLKRCYADQQRHLNGKAIKLPFDDNK